MTEQPRYPQLGVRTPVDGRPHVLLVERIAPFSVEMIYSLAYWWQARSRCTVSVLNIWPADTYGALPPSLDLRAFDAVVVFPRLGWDPVTLEFLDRRLPVSFRQYDGLKMLMRQDENLMTSRIEDFLIAGEFDVLLTCVPQDQVCVAYPRLAQFGIATRTVLTGYVTPDMRSFARAPYEARTIDLSYRAYRGSFSNGSLVRDKYLIGVQALQHFADRGLALDISLDPADRLIGTDWRNHLNASKAVLGTESGTNLFDFDGSIYRWAQLFEHEHRNSDLSDEQLYDIAKVVLEPTDGNVRYSQVSPRHFEAAAFGSMQVLFPGEYSGIFRPGRHYLPLDRDFSNRDEIVEAIKDPAMVRRLTDQAFEEIVLNPDLWIETAISELDALVEAAAVERRGPTWIAEPGRVPPTRYGFADGDLLHLVASASTIRPLPYYIDRTIEIAGARCVRVVLDADADQVPRSDAIVSWIGLSLPRWTPGGRPATRWPDHVTTVLAKVAKAADLTRPEVEAQLGGYTDNHGSVTQFQADCRLALRTVRAVSEWLDGGLRPGAMMSSDPMTLPAAALAAETLGIDLYVDFEGISRVLTASHGWQAKFWQDVVTALVDDTERSHVVAATAAVVSRARGLLGPGANVVQPGEEPGGLRFGVVVSRPPGSHETGTVPRELEAFADPNVSTLVASHAILAQEVLPAIERTFGLESARYWAAVRDAVASFRDRDDDHSATALLFVVLDRYAATRRGHPDNAPLVERLDHWSALVLNLLVEQKGPGTVTAIRAIHDRIADGDIPITAENRRTAWRLAVQLRSNGETARFAQLSASLMATVDHADPASVSADVFGLLNLLAHHWTRGEYPEAASYAEALLVFHHRPEDRGGVRLDENILARIRRIQASTSLVDPPSDTPSPPDQPAASTSGRGALVRAARSVRHRVARRRRRV